MPVTDKMITRDKMFFETSSDDKLTLDPILTDLEKSKKGDRIPILDEQFHPKYIVHRSVIDQYFADKAVDDKINADGLTKLTLEQLIKDHSELKQSFGIVAENSTLADAKKVMDGIPIARMCLFQRMDRKRKL